MSQPVTLQPETARAVFRLIDNVSLVRMIRENSLSPTDVRALMDLWSSLEPVYGPRSAHA